MRQIPWAALLSGWPAMRDMTLFCELVSGYRVRPAEKRTGWNPTDGWDPSTMRWPERPAAVQERLL